MDAAAGTSTRAIIQAELIRLRDDDDDDDDGSRTHTAAVPDMDSSRTVCHQSTDNRFLLGMLDDGEARVGKRGGQQDEIAGARLDREAQLLEAKSLEIMRVAYGGFDTYSGV